MNEQISTIQTREVLELMRNLAPILNEKEMFEFMLFSNRVLKRYMPECYNDELSDEVTEMRKDKAWLKGLINEEGIVIDMHLLDRLDNQYWKNENIKINKGRLFYLIDQLDEPEQTDTNVGLSKVVIPQFVADWIERQKQPDWDYENKEDALADSIHFTLYSLEANYPETNPDVVLRKPVNEWLNDDRKNYWKLIDGVRYGYEVEKEKKYIVDIEGILFLAKFDDEPDVDAYGETILYNDDYIIELTEKEIKDYDERYWAFAQEVME